LKEHGIFHGDLKRDNLLLDSNLDIVVGDFGMAEYVMDLTRSP
jgi:serine/threonine protein kinase